MTTADSASSGDIQRAVVAVADTEVDAIGDTTLESIMTSTSANTMFIHGALIGTGASALVGGNGATEELEDLFNVSHGHIVFEIRTSSGANTISSDWTTTASGLSNGAVIVAA